MPQFSHLHVHTQFSLLDGAADISKLYEKAIADNMPAMAITDHGNMFGAFKFVAEAYKHKGADGKPLVKPIVGCEFYVVADRHKKTFTKEDRDKRYHQLFLAKNDEGYRNLIKLTSLGYIEGLYSKYPRIDKELILKYHKGLIATTCCIGAMVPKAILRNGEEEAEKEFKWWLDLFGDDYYIELQRHDIPEQNKVNEVLLKFAAKYQVPIIASNDSHYVDQKDANAHDILLCINTGEKQSTPSLKEFNDDEVSVKGKRFAFANDQFYFKKTDEMMQLFSDIPQAIDNTNQIVDKIDLLDLKRDILLPNFPVPEGFSSQMDYLEHLTWEGAKQRYVEINEEIEERLKFELHTIRTMGFAGYFLIVSDFIKAGREMGVSIGPGRGSAAGSAVAYCIGITNIDPIKYQLLFERFLNPDRKSMPDIDTDFDDEGRQRVIDYVVNKYGKNQVSQIVTYGSMAAKMSIKDVARVLDLSLNESNMLAKLVPEKPGISLKRVLTAPIEGEKSLKEKEGLANEDIENVKALREHYAGDDLKSTVLKEALVLEGSVRGTGVHAAGIIIAPRDLTDLIPMAVAKDSDLLITQYDGKVIEDAGVIKMDFLGLRNLTIIRDALKLIKQNHGIDIDIDAIPLDDKATLELFARGETNGTFQFESSGMQKYLKELKPDRFEDLIAMNALYRPGPLAYIPNFIDRKHGKEEVVYDLPEMEEHLKDTYGITVYQEQVMLLSQKLADFTKGDADVLRKAMGKKDRKTLDKLKPQFVENASKKGHNRNALEKIWTDWEAFASYAFNKSHSTCYAYVAFQTGYLKAHYPGEYMSAVLTNNQSNIDKVSFFMEECRRMGINVLGPDINESNVNFSVNKKGEIRFGLGAIKGVGEAAMKEIIEEREKNGHFTSIFDLTKRMINTRTINKKVLEGLALSGAFDGFPNIHRAQYFFPEHGDEPNLLEKALRFASNVAANENANQQSLFGGTASVTLAEPIIPACEQWSLIHKLKKEKEVVGMYLSGHPLDTYKLEFQYFVNSEIATVNDKKNNEISIAGIVVDSYEKVSQKNNKPYGGFTIEDYSGQLRIMMWSEEYLKYRHLLSNGQMLYVKGRMKPSFKDQNQYDFSVQSIFLLADVREKFVKSVHVELNADKINKSFIQQFSQFVNTNKGAFDLKLNLYDELLKYKVTAHSRSYKINLDNSVIKELDSMGVSFKINSQT
ncbi:MAG: DNA polymerase III subunit alpha [Bacteroidia bacterium]|nr:DNA polymerase III subunit alpha [Bacteroidia bacterium]